MRERKLPERVTDGAAIGSQTDPSDSQPTALQPLVRGKAMDKQTAKVILSAYRHDGSDVFEEEFAESLNVCGRDPEIARWLEKQFAFDRNVIAALNSIRGPETGKRCILVSARWESEQARPRPISRLRNGWRAGAIAALVAIAATLAFHHRPERIPAYADTSGAGWLVQASALATNALPLDRIESRLAPAVQWLTEQGAPTTATLPANLTGAARLAGCRSFDLAPTKKASLLCFELDGALVHLFVIDKATIGATRFPERRWTNERGWNLYAWTEGDKVVTIASKLPPSRLDELVRTS